MALEPKYNELAAFLLPEDAPIGDKEKLALYIQEAAEEWLEDNGYGPDEVEPDSDEDPE